MNFFLTCKRWTKGRNFSKQWSNFAHCNQTKSSLHYTLYLTGRETDVHLFAKSAAAEHLTFSMEYFQIPISSSFCMYFVLVRHRSNARPWKSQQCTAVKGSPALRCTSQPKVRSHGFRVPPLLPDWTAASSLHLLLMQTQTPDGNINS